MGTKAVAPFVPRLTPEKILEKNSKVENLFSKAKQQILELKDDITSGGTLGTHRHRISCEPLQPLASPSIGFGAGTASSLRLGI
jgi:hypothetical protein